MSNKSGEGQTQRRASADAVPAAGEKRPRAGVFFVFRFAASASTEALAAEALPAPPGCWLKNGLS